MPPRSPLPRRHGLDAAWVRTPDRSGAAPPWTSMGTWLEQRLHPDARVAEMLAAGRFVYADGAPVRAGDGYRPHTFVWFHRELRAEPVVPGGLPVLHRDERVVVVDKPPFLSSIPRGRHVTQSVVVRLRDELGLPGLAPAHRLDRGTAGVLLLTTERRWRAPYQSLFEHRLVRKRYRALAGVRPGLKLPVVVRDHLRKERGVLQAGVVPGLAPNAETMVELEDVRDGLGHYLLTPHTGRTHQLRLHLAGLGIPIVDDPLYPRVREVEVDDFSRPMQLLAAELAFTDPVDGSGCGFASTRTLPLPSTPAAGD